MKQLGLKPLSMKLKKILAVNQSAANVSGRGHCELPIVRSIRPAIVDLEDFNRCIKIKWYRSKRAGYIFGYVGGQEKKKRVSLHSFIVRKKFILPVGTLIDHRNRNKSDCRKQNLRVGTKAQNSQNSKKRSGNKVTSKFKGVGLHKPTGLWHAKIHVLGKSVSLKYFKLEEDAAHAYDEAAKYYFGEFANLNFQ